MNITEYHPLKCKYSGTYWIWSKENKKFEAYSCSECLRSNMQEDECEDPYIAN